MPGRLVVSRRLAPDHSRYRAWLELIDAARESFGLSELVLSGAVRVLTPPRLRSAHAAAGRAGVRERARRATDAVLLAPGLRHWEIFTHLLSAARARGNFVADAYHAALAVEHGCDWRTTDRDYARFPGLRWRHPLD